MYVFFSSSSFFSILSPFLSFACVPLVESCWHRTSLILLHHVCVLLVSLLSETSDLHVDLRASALWENVCGLYVYGKKVGGSNGWGQSEWGGKLESWNAEQSDTLAWEGRFSEVPCCPSSYCPSICECLGMRLSCMLASDHHTSSPGLLGKSKEKMCPSGLLCCSSESVPPFIVSGCRKAWPLTLQKLQLYHCKLRQILLPVDEIAQPFWNIL